jgi:pimeloyl-ACP methyl ester carboxylesterase
MTSASNPAANFYATGRTASLLAASLRAAHALQPALGTRLATRIFFTVLPNKLAARRQRLGRQWRAERWPFERASLTLYRHAEADTSHPLVLLVHGWGGHAQQMLPLADALRADGLQPALLEFPGHGASDGWSSTLPQFLRALEYVATQLGDVHAVVAHSLGALAAAAAVGRGLAVRRLVLLAASPPPQQVTGWFAGNFGLDAAALARFRRHIEAREGLPLSIFEPERLGPRLNVPSLLVHDTGDRAAPFGTSQRLLTLAPRAQLLAVEGLGHKRILADAAVVARVRDWCKPG